MDICFISKLVWGKKKKKRRKKDFPKAAALDCRYHTPSKSIHHFNYIYMGINWI